MNLSTDSAPSVTLRKESCDSGWITRRISDGAEMSRRVWSREYAAANAITSMMYHSVLREVYSEKLQAPDSGKRIAYDVLLGAFPVVRASSALLDALERCAAASLATYMQGVVVAGAGTPARTPSNDFAFLALLKLSGRGLLDTACPVCGTEDVGGGCHCACRTVAVLRPCGHAVCARSRESGVPSCDRRLILDSQPSEPEVCPLCQVTVSSIIPNVAHVQDSVGIQVQEFKAAARRALLDAGVELCTPSASADAMPVPAHEW